MTLVRHKFPFKMFISSKFGYLVLNTNYLADSFSISHNFFFRLYFISLNAYCPWHMPLYNHCTNLCTQILNVNHINLTEQTKACVYVCVCVFVCVNVCIFVYLCSLYRYYLSKTNALLNFLYACKDVF